MVGFGAILPGISGGTLSVAFGMYRPIIETISNLKEGLKKHFFMLATFFAGIATGFMGLSGVAAWMLEKDTVLITCLFVGFILGTIPQLWQEAGEKGRTKKCYIAMCAGLVIMLLVLYIFKSELRITVVPNFTGYIICGLLWGLSFIVPGLSSSTLLLFFGLYQPMLKGISTLDFRVLAPMAVGMLGCVLILSNIVGYAYEKHYAIMSHIVIGIVLATTFMIVPFQYTSLPIVLMHVFAVMVGSLMAYKFSSICMSMQEKVKDK